MLYLAVAVYHMSRFGINNIDPDEMRFNQSIELVQNLGTTPLTDRVQDVYTYGFGYQSVIVFLSALTSLDVRTLQFFSRLWFPVIGLFLFMLFRTVTNSNTVAALGIIFVLLVPDTVFYLLRQTHEKLTWAYAILMIYIWIKSYQNRNSLRSLIVYIILFYIFFLGMVTTHVFFASTISMTFILSTIVGWVVILILKLRSKQIIESYAVQRFTYLILTTLLISYIIISYIYHPALAFYSSLSKAGERLSVLFLASDTATTTSTTSLVPSSYARVGSIWASIYVYGLITLAQWIILGLSLLFCVVLVYRLYNRRDVSPSLLFAVVFYLGFATQVGIGAITDILSINKFDNLQLRIFVPFGMIMALLAAILVSDILRRLSGSRKLLGVAALYLFVLLGITGSALKFTNDPLVSNRFFFFNNYELEALTWVDTHTHDTEIWTDLWGHLLGVWLYNNPVQNESNFYTYGGNYVATSVRHLVLTDRVVSSMDLQNYPVYSVNETETLWRVYDSGYTRIMYKPPQTPYQP